MRRDTDADAIRIEILRLQANKARTKRLAARERLARRIGALKFLLLMRAA